jgi:penicillin-binding protein 1A
LVGGINYADSQFNRAVEAHRQAGSSWKPFVYLTAMEAGRTPTTEVVDEPVTINNWSPRNFEPEYLGDITLQTALAHSINTVAARLADEVGRDNVARTAHRLGIVSQINTDPAMALGTTLVTPLEMAQAYTAFANGGARANAYGIERIRVATGKVVYQHRTDPRVQVIDNPPLTEMNTMLRDVLVEGTGAHAAIRGYDLAGKTGTTSDYKDAWFCGFTGGLTTVVWVGKDDNTSMQGVTGGQAPASLWRAYMAAALPRVHPSAIPAGPPAPLIAPDAATDRQDPAPLTPSASDDPITDLLRPGKPAPPAQPPADEPDR